MHERAPSVPTNSGEHVDNTRKYHVIVEPESADGLEVPPGTEVCFVFKRHGKVSFSPSTEVWEDGIAYWDAKCSQICTIHRDSNGVSRTKHSDMEIQTISLDDNGEPVCLGYTLASAPVDLARFCSHDFDDEPCEPQKLTVQLLPQGTVTFHISSVWLKHWSGSHHDDTSSEHSITPTHSKAGSLNPDDFAATPRGGYVSGASSPGPREKVHSHRSHHHDKHNLSAVKEVTGDGNYPEVPYGTPDRLHHGHGPPESVDGDDWDAAMYSAMAHIEPSLASTGLGRSSSRASSESGSDVSSVTALKRRCMRLAKERDEARAESFAEASVAVQRGIEIENLRRAKDMLLQRLEDTERQFMMAMRLEPESPTSNGSVDSTDRAGVVVASTTTKAAPATQPVGGAVTPKPYADTEAVIHALVEAKVSLAEKEFEIMELQGKLRAQESHVDALTDHLTAVRQSVEQRSFMLDTPGSRRSMRSVFHTPHVTPPWTNPGKEKSRRSTVRRGSNVLFGEETPPTPDSGDDVQIPAAGGLAEEAGEVGAKRPAAMVHIIAHAQAEGQVVS